MKAAAFDYAAPKDVAEAVRLLADAHGTAKAIAGGQSLGPMLNLRLAQPALLVDIRRLDELRAVEETADAVVYGACVTHAEIEDGKRPDPTGGFLRRVAAGIAYRAIRNRGTLGGSLCHADPAADWMTAMILAGATMTVRGPAGARDVAARDWMLGTFAPAAGEDEILVRVRVPKRGPRAKFGYRKLCRKTGEFAQAIAGWLDDPERGETRLVLGAVDGPPIVLEGEAARAPLDPSRVGDAYKARVLPVLARRAAA